MGGYFKRNEELKVSFKPQVSYLTLRFDTLLGHKGKIYTSQLLEIKKKDMKVEPMTENELCTGNTKVTRLDSSTNVTIIKAQQSALT